MNKLIQKRIFFILIFFFCLGNLISQTEAILKVDTCRIVLKPGLSFPYWLNAGQTIKKEAVIKTISVIEFNLDSIGNLRFVKPMSITNSDEISVPEGKVWKIEAIGLRETLEYGKEGVTSQTTRDFSNGTKPAIFTSPAIFTTPGSFKWTVPPDVNRICVEIWGAGGSGGDAIYSGATNTDNSLQSLFAGGGGGGTYGYQCFDVKPNSTFEIYVGYSDEATYVGNLIKVEAGQKGTNAISTITDFTVGVAGEGGVTNAYFKELPKKKNQSFYGCDAANNGGKGSESLKNGSTLYSNYAQWMWVADGNWCNDFGGGGAGGYIQFQGSIPINTYQAVGGKGGGGRINIFW